MRPSFGLTRDYDFSVVDFGRFEQVPHIALERSISGAVLAEEDAYTLSAVDSIIDAGSGIGDATPAFALASLADPVNAWGPALELAGLTCFGRARVASVAGEGGIFVHALQAHDNQRGCVRFSWFSGADDRLPPHHGCVFGPHARLAFTDERFGMPGYAQLRRSSDARVLEQGPGRDLMGAFAYLRNSHKWKNLSIRFREFMPVGVRPVLIPVT
jgi:hypothetical protein